MKTMSQILIAIAATAIVGGGVAGGFVYYNNSTSYYKTDDARIAAPLSDVSATMPGVLTELLVNTGDKVSAGQTIARVKASGANGTVAYVNVDAVAAGTVINVPVKVGDLVAPGQTVASVADLTKVYLSANVEETRIKDVVAGEKVDITIDAYSGTDYSGKIDRVGDVTTSQLSVLPAMNASGNYTKVVQRVPVTISLDNTNNTVLKPGMNASITIHVK